MTLDMMNLSMKASKKVISLLVLLVATGLSSSLVYAETKSDQPLPPLPPTMAAALPAPNPDLVTPREAEVAKLQQDTEIKYINSLNDLQMLRVNREIAETTQAISAAELANVKSKRDIVNILSGPNAMMPQNKGGDAQMQQPEIPYKVVSVSMVQHRWGAVLSVNSTMFSVGIGDALPPDGSTVVAIDKLGVVLEKDGAQRKITLASIL